MQIFQVLFAVWMFCTKTGKQALLAPVRVYRAFSGVEALHWTEWLSATCTIALLWDIVFWWVGPRDPLATGVIGGTLGAMIAMWVLAIIFGVLGRISANLGQFRPLRFLLWHPGNKQFRLFLLGQKREAPPSPIFTGSTSGAAKFDETLLRGTRIVDGAALGHQQRNSAAPGAFDLNIEWGGCYAPYDKECEHFLIEGKTGAGKTQAINEMLRKVRRRKQSAIIADPAGGYLARFGNAMGQNLILNPFDKRTLHWSPFADIKQEYDCYRIAKAAIPDGLGDSQSWNNYAQSLFGETMIAMVRRGERSIQKLLDYCMVATGEELHNLLSGTSADILTQQGNEKMLSNTRAILGVYLAPWRYIKDCGTFSIREWVRSTDTKPSWLYLTYRDDQMAMLRNLVSCWLEIAIVEALSLSENQDRRLFFIMDELDSLGKVTSLRGGLTKLRKYGGVCVAGLQTIAQLQGTYGPKEAQTLLSCMSNKLILKAGDGETAKYFENEIGQQEIEREESSHSEGSQMSMQGGGQNQGTSKAVRRSTQAAVLASELMNLDNLHGYLMLTGLPLARIKLTYQAMPEQVPAFAEEPVSTFAVGETR